MATDTTVKYFSWDMRGAPQLSREPNKLRDIIHACLVTGFGDITPSAVSVLDGIATASVSPGERFNVDSVIEITGDSSALNGQYRVISSTDSSLTWNTSAPNGTSTGFINIKSAPAGWEKVWDDAAGAAAWKSSDPSATGNLFSINDNGARVARIRALESIDENDVGINPAPNDSQVSGGFYWPKSGVADSSPKKWFLAANSKSFLLGVDSGPYNTGVQVVGAGDLISFSPSDAYSFYVSGMTFDTSSYNGQIYESLETSYVSSSYLSYVLRDEFGNGISKPYSKKCYAANNSLSTSGQSYNWGATLGNLTNTLQMSEVTLANDYQFARGKIPGLYHVLQNVFSFFNHGTILKTSGFPAKKYIVWRTGSPYTASYQGMILIDITGPWE